MLGAFFSSAFPSLQRVQENKSPKETQKIENNQSLKQSIKIIYPDLLIINEHIISKSSNHPPPSQSSKSNISIAAQPAHRTQNNPRTAEILQTDKLATPIDFSLAMIKNLFTIDFFLQGSTGLFPQYSFDTFFSYKPFTQFLMIKIEVQHCIDCPTHNWCSRHNQEKYHQFYHKLEAKATSLHKDVSIVRNIHSSYSPNKNSLSTLTKDGNRYFDDRSKSTIIFPRHGAFQIRVNGVLIFSKLQSNLWPNIQKVGQTLLEIGEDIQAGRDIQKFSIQCKQGLSLENERQNDTNKKTPNFKIKNRPHSSQFNATPYLQKSALQPSLPFNPKKSNALSLNKTHIKQRKSQVDKKALMRMRERKQEQANTYYNDYNDFKDSTIQEFSSVKVAKNQISPISKKKIQFRNEVLYPLKVPFHISNKQQKETHLQKKPSRKLIIKAAQRKNVQFVFHQPSNHEELNSQDNQKLLTKQELRVEEYQTEKTIEKVSINQIQADQLQPEQEHLYEEEDLTFPNKLQELVEEAHNYQQQHIPPSSQSNAKEDNIQDKIPQQQHSLKQELRNSISKAESDHNQQQQVLQIVIERKDALFDELELRDTEHNQIIEKEQHYDDFIVQKEEQILEYQEIVEANFKVKQEIYSQSNHIVQQQSSYKIEEEKEIPVSISKEQIDKDIIHASVQQQDILQENEQQVIKINENNDQEANMIQPSVLCSSSQEENIPIVLTEKNLPIQSDLTEINTKEGHQLEILREVPSQQPAQKINEIDAIEDNMQVQVTLLQRNLMQQDPFSLGANRTEKIIEQEIGEWLQQKYADCLQALQEDNQHNHSIEQIEELLNIKDSPAMIELPQRLESIAQKKAEEEVMIVQNHEEKYSDNEENVWPLPQGPIEELPTQKDSQKNISISNILEASYNPEHPTMKQIPNPTESSIALTNQVHSQLNCVYEDIEAKIEERLAAQQSF